jgi:hypothetical protein
MTMSIRRPKRYIAVTRDAEGVTHRYVFSATSQRRAKKDARAWVAEWEGATLVGIKPAGAATGGRRLLAVAAVAFAVSGTTIGAAMIVGLRLEGAL